MSSRFQVPGPRSRRRRSSAHALITLGSLLFSCAVICFYFHYHPLRPGALAASGWLVLCDFAPAAATTLRLAAELFLYLALFLALAFISYGLGEPVLKRLRVRTASAVEAAAFSIALGFLVLYLCLFALASLGLLRPNLLRLVLVVAFFAFLFRPPHSLSGLLALLRGLGTGTPRPMDVFFLFVGFSFLLLGLLGCLLPVWWLDDQLTHIGLPRLFLNAGGLVERPYAICSDHFLTAEMVNAACLCLGGEAFVKSFNSLAVLLLFLAFGGYCIRYKCEAAFLPACALFLAVPVMGFTSIVAAVANVQSWLLFSAVFALLIWMEGKRATDGWLVLSGLLLGGAISVKMDTVLWYPLFLCGYLYAAGGRGEGAALILRRGAFFSLAALLPVSPWLVKNWVFVGDPVFPLWHEWFRLKGVSSERVAVWLGDVGKYGMKYGNPISYLRLPWDLSVDRYNSFNSFSPGPIFLALLPLAFFVRPARHVSWLLLFGWLYLVPWALTAQQARYLLPALALLSLASAQLLVALRRPPALRRAYGALFAAFLLVSLAWLAQQRLANRVFFPYLFGHLDDQALLCELSSSHTMIDFINKGTDAGAKILFIGEDETYHCRRDCLWEKFWQKAAVTYYLERAGTLSEFLRALQRDGVTHVALNRGKFEDWKKRFGKYAWSERQELVLNQALHAHARVVFRSAGNVLYALN